MVYKLTHEKAFCSENDLKTFSIGENVFMQTHDFGKQMFFQVRTRRSCWGSAKKIETVLLRIVSAHVKLSLLIYMFLEKLHLWAGVYNSFFLVAKKA